MSWIFHNVTYEIEAAGYYLRKNPHAPAIGSVAWLFSDLAKWARGKPLEETKTFQPAEDEESDPVYLFDISDKSRHGNYVITTWNEVEMTEGGVQTASATGVVGKVDVALAEVDEGQIPGYPTYFYVIPTKGMLITVRPEGTRRNGHMGLNRYLQGFLTYFSSAVVIDEASKDLDVKVVGYRDPSKPKELPKPLIPRFRSHLMRLPGQLDFLTENRAKIRKVVRRDTLNPGAPADTSVLKVLLENLGLIDPKIPASAAKLGYEVDYSPSEKELQTIIDSAYADNDQKADVGFLMHGDDEVFWLSHSLHKSEIDLAIRPSGNDVFTAKDILEQLDGKLYDSL